MNKKLFSVMIILAFAGALFGQACSEYGTMSSTGSSSSSSTFTLSAGTTTLAVSAQTQISATGGSPPFIWSVESGGGNISTNGIYTAPGSTPALNGTVLISCRDIEGKIAHLTLYIGANTLNVSYSPNPANPGQSILISIVGGSAPYTIQKLNGAGTVSGNYYQATGTSETATFEVADANGLRANLSIPIGLSGTVLTALSMTSLGTHIRAIDQPGGGCVSPATDVGQVADGGSGNRLFGDQVFCGTMVAAASGVQMISDIYISDAPGTHSPNPTCNAGYSKIGAVVDCSGSCSGSQAICVKYSTIGSGQAPVREFRVTSQYVHQDIPSCGSLTTIGYTAACGQGNCSGYQAFCIKK